MCKFVDVSRKKLNMSLLKDIKLEIIANYYIIDGECSYMMCGLITFIQHGSLRTWLNAVQKLRL